VLSLGVLIFDVLIFDVLIFDVLTTATFYRTRVRYARPALSRPRRGMRHHRLGYRRCGTPASTMTRKGAPDDATPAAARSMSAP